MKIYMFINISKVEFIGDIKMRRDFYLSRVYRLVSLIRIVIVLI